MFSDLKRFLEDGAGLIIALLLFVFVFFRIFFIVDEGTAFLLAGIGLFVLIAFIAYRVISFFTGD